MCMVKSKHDFVKNNYIFKYILSLVILILIHDHSGIITTVNNFQQKLREKNGFFLKKIRIGSEHL